MKHSDGDGAHTQGRNAGSGPLGQLTEIIAILGVVVVGIDAVMWLLHILVIIATAIGFVALGAGAGYAAVKWRRFQRRQHGSHQLYPPAPASQFLAYPDTERQLPAVGHIHPHLPPGITAEEVARIMYRQASALPGAADWGGWNEAR
jgi:hypothetical protein